MEVPASDAVATMEPLDLQEGDLIEGAVLLVKVSTGDGPGALYRCISPGMSHWEALGILTDAANDVLGGGWDN